MEETSISKAEKYQQMVAEDFTFNDVTIYDKAYKVPQNKHKWLTILYKERKNLMLLERLKKKAEQEAAAKQNNLVTLSNASKKNILANNLTIMQITDKIQDQKLLVEYVESIAKMSAFVGNDVQNIIELMKLEVN